MTPPSRYWQDLSTRQFAALDLSRWVAIQPVAAIEQHGPHLPVSVDATINAGILDRAAALLPPETAALVLPPLPVGKSNEHQAFPGTLSLGFETLARVWLEIARSVRRAGCRKILFFNAHGGQPQLVEIVCRELRVEDEMLAVGCSWSAITPHADLIGEDERAFGIHAGLVETSMMLHLAPERVAMDQAQTFASRAAEVRSRNAELSFEGAVGMGWQTQDLNAFGACGDASAATAELGRELVERAAAALVRLILEIEAYPLDALRRGAAYASEP